MSGEDRRNTPEGEWPRKDAPSHLPFQGSITEGDSAPWQPDAHVPPPDWIRDAGIPPVDTLPTAHLPSHPVVPGVTPRNKRPAPFLPSVSPSDARRARANTTNFDDIPEDERPTTVLPVHAKPRRRWTRDASAVPLQHDDDIPIDQQETTLLPAQGTLFRDVTRTWFTGPLPIIDVDQHFTGPLPSTGPMPAIIVDRIAAESPASHTLSAPSLLNARLQRVRLIPPEEDERLEALAQMSTMVMPAIPGDAGIYLPTEQDRGVDLTETAGTRAVRAAKSHTFVINLAKSSGVYALSALAAPLVSLVLAPFLTHHLTPNEYGLLAVLTTAVGLTAGITQLGLNSAFFRAYNYDYTSAQDRRGVVSTVWMLLVTVGLPICAGIVVGAPLIARVLLGDVSQAPLVRIAGLVCLAQNLTVPGYAWLRAESKALYFSLLSIVSLVVTLGTNVIFVGMLNLGLTGATAALGTGYAAVVICTAPFLIFRAGVRFRRDIAMSVLAFGLPLVLNFASYWVLQLSDRFLLARMSSLTATAEYAVAYTMGSALSALIISPFTLAWPTSMFTIAKRKDAARIFGLVFRGFAAMLYFSAFGLSLLATLFLQQLFPPAYHDAGPIIALITASIVFYGVYFLFMIGANVLRKTWLTAVFTTSAAMLNVGCNLLLIPRFGGIGAAASTLLAYIVLAGLAYAVNQRIYPLPFQITTWLLMGAVGAALYIACWRLPLPVEPMAAWACRFGICLLYGLLLFFYGGGMRLLRLAMKRSRSVVPAAGGAIA